MPILQSSQLACSESSGSCFPTRGELAHRLRTAGPRALGDDEALAFILGLSADRSLELLARFGSLPEVLGASSAALRRELSPSAADRVGLIQDLARRLHEAPLRKRAVIASSSALLAYVRTVLAGRGREAFHVLYLDRRNRLIADERMGEGTVDHAPVYPREVVRRALELDATGLILLHNHPAGDPTPSTADVEMTRQVNAAAKCLRLTLHDHLIVAGDHVASLNALGLL